MKHALLVLLFAFASAGAAEPTYWPAGDGVCIDAPLRLTFASPPELGTSGKLEVFRAAGGAPIETVDLSAGSFLDRFGATGGYLLKYEPAWVEGNTVCVRLHTGTLAYGESYLVRVSAGFVKDFAGVQDGWTFRTKPAPARNPDRLAVAADGTGDFCTVQGAVNQVEPHRSAPVGIYIKKGHYHELVRIGRERRFVRLVGEDRDATVISYTNNDKLNPGWIQRSVLGVEADDFALGNLTVQNTTPYKGSQAEAVYVNADRVVLRDARFLSLQDTLGLSGRVYVATSYIEGDVDYVWGYGTACFERCELRSMHDGYIVQARNPPERGGYLFLDCRLTSAPDVKKCWLARIEAERFPASHVGFIRCRMGAHILPAGWQVTGAATSALRFEEFGSMDLEGHPLDVSARDAASTQLTSERAATQTAAQLLGGADGFKPVAEPPRMVIIGDSTVCEYPEASPSRGWGHYIQGYFKDGIKVVNLAASGRSTKTFIAEGRWQKALDEKPRYILIQFGHNDSHPAERPEATDAATTYPDFLRRYIDEARAIGAIPILVTPMVRRLFEGDHLRDELAPYAAAMQKVAAEKKVPIVNLHDSSKQLVEKLGEEKSMEFANAPTDRTHFNEKGAKAMAELVMKELPDAEPSLKAHLK
jgi:lysophospholipase L1-like esterase